MKIMTALKGLDDGYEVQRILGALGTVVYIVSAPALVWLDKVPVTFETYCIAYPAGIAALLGATAGAIAIKDNSVARAKNVGQPQPAPTG